MIFAGNFSYKISEFYMIARKIFSPNFGKGPARAPLPPSPTPWAEFCFHRKSKSLHSVRFANEVCLKAYRHIELVYKVEATFLCVSVCVCVFCFLVKGDQKTPAEEGKVRYTIKSMFIIQRPIKR